ncbi:MAG: nitrile hydratase subunit beta [Alphaproteobacteria bacterium]|nr:nitrile hydratase subunit beta [Alphaproteobacteria bacterium]
MRSHHDMGGQPAGPVEIGEHDYDIWEKRIDALMSLLIQEERLMRVDELRRGIEALAPDAYASLSYYERWIASITAILVEKGVLDEAEVKARVAEVAAREGEA